MLILAGLGNPGRRYAGNRHNIGFMAVDEIHRRHTFSPWRARFEAEVSEGLLGGEKALLVKPVTYMNESGRAVGQALRFYKTDPGDVVVIYDELDLPPGKLRMKTGGSTAGHKGLRSIEAHIGKNFRRMRLGIGHPGAKEAVNRHVLRDFAKADREWIDPLLSAIADNAALLARGDDANFMNRVHLATADEGVSGKDVPPSAKPTTKTVVAAPHQGRGMGGILAAGLKRLIHRE